MYVSCMAKPNYIDVNRACLKINDKEIFLDFSKKKFHNEPLMHQYRLEEKHR